MKYSSVFTAIALIACSVASAEEKNSDSGQTGTPPGLARFAGKWVIHYQTGAVRNYVIGSGGEVSWVDFDPPKTCQIVVKGNDYLIDFQDDKIERIKKKGLALSVEHFDPKAKYQNHTPGMPGTGTKIK